MRVRILRPRNWERGQSTAEFALMMPVLLAMFFWIMEFNIFLSAMHQASYASFAAARLHVVNTQGYDLQNEVVDKILSGKLYMESKTGKVTTATHSRGKNSAGADSKWQNEPDGVVLKLPTFDSLPYARSIMFMENVEMPTHLGPMEKNKKIWNDNVRDQDNKPDTETDNNAADKN